MHSDMEEYKEQEQRERSEIDTKIDRQGGKKNGKDGEKKQIISRCIWHSSVCPACVLSSYSTVQPSYSKASHITFHIGLQHYLSLPPTSSYSLCLSVSLSLNPLLTPQLLSVRLSNNTFGHTEDGFCMWECFHISSLFFFCSPQKGRVCFSQSWVTRADTFQYNAIYRQMSNTIDFPKC